MNQGKAYAVGAVTSPPRQSSASHPRSTGRWVRQGWLGLGILVAAGCTGVPPAAVAHGTAVRPVMAAGAAAVPGSLVRVPVPDYASPASVASAFYVAWASVDAIHDGPGAVAARCAPLVTPSLEAQLAASQPGTAAWAAMRKDRMVSLVHVQAVTRPNGAPAPTLFLSYMRVYATRVTTSTTGQATASGGITVQLADIGGRWLVARVLFF